MQHAKRGWHAAEGVKVQPVRLLLVLLLRRLRIGVGVGVVGRGGSSSSAAPVEAVVVARDRGAGAAAVLRGRKVGVCVVCVTQLGSLCSIPGFDLAAMMAKKSWLRPPKSDPTDPATKQTHRLPVAVGRQAERIDVSRQFKARGALPRRQAGGGRGARGVHCLKT